MQEDTKDLEPLSGASIGDIALKDSGSSKVDALASSKDAEGLSPFSLLGLDELSLQAIARKGFTVPTPIQALAIPRLLNGNANIVARARTGTGKTAAFGLPLVQKLRGSAGAVKGLILEPTRELAIQTNKEMASFVVGKAPASTVLYGGAAMGEQLRALKRGVQIVVGTPGRIKDHIERGSLELSELEYFILDEADEMLDMGFIEDIESIFEKAPKGCRVLLFSATMPAPILKIAKHFMGEYEVIAEAVKEEPPLLIKQSYWLVRSSEKIEALVRLIDISQDFYGLVFTRTKVLADTVTRMLDERGYEVQALHGDIVQGQREKILARFASKKTRILVATDVAARGIDIEGITHVVNYDLPNDAEGYTHRIGRTGRAGACGMAISFVLPGERGRIEYFRSASRKATSSELTQGKIPSIEEVLEAKRRRMFCDMKRKLGLDEGQSVEGKATKPTNIEGHSSGPSAPSIDSVVERPTKATMDAPVGNAIASPMGTFVDGNIDSTIEETAKMADTVVAKSITHTVEELLKASPVFSSMAKDLCVGQDAQVILAAVLAITYGKALDRTRYGAIGSSNLGGRGARSKDYLTQGTPDMEGKERVYIRLGRKDKAGPKEVADFFVKLLKIPNRLVDDIRVMDCFSLVTLPRDLALSALKKAKEDTSLPELHLDTKDSSWHIKPRGGRRSKEGYSDRQYNFSLKAGGARARYGSRDSTKAYSYGKDKRERERRPHRGERERTRDIEPKKARSDFRTPTERSASSSYWHRDKE